MRPRVRRQRAPRIHVRVRTTKRATPRRPPTIERRALQVVVVVPLVDHVAPPIRRRRRIHPRLQRHRTREMQRRRISHIHPRIAPVENKRTPKLPRRRPRRPHNRPHIPTPRRIPHRQPRPLIKPPRPNQPRRGRLGRRGRGVRVRAGVAGRVTGANPVAVARSRREPRIGVARARGCRDLGEARAACPLAAKNLITGDRDVVARRAPGKTDRTRPGRRRRQRARRRRRRRVRADARLRTDRRRRGLVPGSVERGHTKHVAVITAEPTEHIARRRRGVHLAAIEIKPVPRHRNIVVRGAPRQRDRRLPHTTRRKPARCARRRRIPTAAAADGGVHVGLDRRGAERRVVDAHLVDPPVEVLPPDRVATDLQRIARHRDRARLRLRRNQRPVHIQPQRRPVIRQRQMRPRVRRQRAPRIHVRVRTTKRATPRRPPTIERRALQVVVVVPLVDHVAPPIRRRRRIHPRLQRHRTREMQRRRISHIHPRIAPVENKRTPKLPRRRPRRPHNRPHIPTPRRIPHRQPRPLIKPPRPNQPRRGRLGRRGRGVRVRAGVAGRVTGANPVAVARSRREPRIGVARARGCRDLGEARAACPLAAKNLITGDRDVVARRAPGKTDRTRPGRRRRQRARRRRRRRVRADARLRTDRRRRGLVPGSVERGHTKHVAVITAEPTEHIARRRRGVHLAAIEIKPVPRHRNIVVRGAPRQRDRRLPHTTRRKPARCARRRRIPTAAAADGGVHVGLDRRGAERRVVDAHLVDPPVEVLPPDRVATDLQRIARHRDRARLRLRRNQRPVHIQPQRRPVIRQRQMRPRVRRQRAPRIHVRVRTTKRATPRRPPTIERRALQVVVVVPLVDHVAPPIRRRRRIHPRLQRHRTREMQRRRISHIHPRIAPVENKRTPKLPRRRPRRPHNRPHIPTPRRIPHRQPRPLIKPPRPNQPGRKRRAIRFDGRKRSRRRRRARRACRGAQGRRPTGTALCRHTEIRYGYRDREHDPHQHALARDQRPLHPPSRVPLVAFYLHSAPRAIVDPGRAPPVRR